MYVIKFMTIFCLLCKKQAESCSDHIPKIRYMVFGREKVVLEEQRVVFFTKQLSNLIVKYVPLDKMK